MFKLIDVYKDPRSIDALYRLLGERTDRINISHRVMPDPRAHARFVRSRPYSAWYLIESRERSLPPAIAGSVYLSKTGEIGIFIFKGQRGRGVGREAVWLLMQKHQGTGRFLANINPKNLASIRFFKKLGFRHIQNTYELRPSNKGKS